MKKKGKKNTRNHIHYKSEDVGRIMRKGRRSACLDEDEGMKEVC